MCRRLGTFTCIIFIVDELMLTFLLINSRRLPVQCVQLSERNLRRLLGHLYQQFDPARWPVLLRLAGFALKVVLFLKFLHCSCRLEVLALSLD